MTTRKRTTHEIEMLVDTFHEATEALNKCYRENNGFSYATISRETNYHAPDFLNNPYTGRFEMKLRWSEDK